MDSVLSRFSFVFVFVFGLIFSCGKAPAPVTNAQTAPPSSSEHPPPPVAAPVPPVTQLPPAPAPPSLPPSLPPVKVWPVVGWPTDYDTIVQSHISSEMISSAPGSLCPNYNKVDKSLFWVNLVKSISYAECNWNRIDRYIENGIPGEDPITHTTVVSEGLLQMSYGDQLSYSGAPDCERMNYSADLGKSLADRSIMDPEINLSCGMEIMTSLLQSNSNVTASLGRYWSTIRSGKMASRNELSLLMPECYQ